MDKKSPSDPKNTQQAAPSSSTQVEEDDPQSDVPNLLVRPKYPIGHGHRVSSTQEPLTSILSHHRVSFQEPPPSARTSSRVSFQEPPPSTRTSSRVSFQEPPPSTRTSSRVSFQESPPSVLASSRVSFQEPPPSALASSRVSFQEPPPSAHTSSRVSFQESPPSAHTSSRVSFQESPPSALAPRRVSIQESPTSILAPRRVSIQESPTTILAPRRVSIQESPTTILAPRRVSIQESPTTILAPRRVSIQESPTTILAPRRVSIQESPTSVLTSRRVSIQESPTSILAPHRVSIQESPTSVLTSRRVSIQESPQFGLIPQRLSVQASLPSAYNRWASSQNAPSGSHSHHLQDSEILTGVPPNTGSYEDINGYLSLSPSSSFTRKQTRPRIDVPPSLTKSPEASIESMDSDSEKSLKEFIPDCQSSQSTLDSSSPMVISSSRLRNRRSRPSLLPMATQLLLEAKKVSRQVSLVLTLAGMMVIAAVSLGQSWIHFQVPLRPPGDPAGSQTIPIDTILFVQCLDASCLHEYDQNAYLLNLAWTCFLISGITGFCICAGLISTFFFPSTSLPLMDIFLFICSLIAGTSIILGVLFYLMQAKKFLQEGMTYTLGISFYLAWTGVLFFLVTGLFSYLNYMNFWSILTLQAIWA